MHDAAVSGGSSAQGAEHCKEVGEDRAPVEA